MKDLQAANCPACANQQPPLDLESLGITCTQDADDVHYFLPTGAVFVVPMDVDFVHLRACLDDADRRSKEPT